MDATALEPTPPESAALVQAAHCEARGGRIASAIDLLRKHLARQVDDYAAWAYQGSLLHRTGSLHAALLCYQRALRGGSESAPLWSNLGRLWTDLDQHRQAQRCHEQALRLAPERLPVLLASCRSACEALRFDAALAAIDRCLALAPGRNDLLEQRAEILFYLGRTAEAWHDLAAAQPVYGRCAPLTRERCAAGLEGQRVLVTTTRGHGMNILAFRYLPLLLDRGAELTVVCDSTLQPLLSAWSVETCSSVPDQGFDCTTPLLRLPWLVDPGGTTIPEPLAIAVDPLRATRYRTLCGGARPLKVAVVWSPSPLGSDWQRRGFEFERLHRLAHLPGVQLVSLQKGLPLHQLLVSRWRNRVVDLGLMLGDFADTAAALSAVDLVLCCDSAVAHLAASMRKPVLLLLHSRAFWLYGLHGDASTWYPTMRLLRQPEAGDWDAVMLEAIGLVEGLAATRAGSAAGAGL